MKFKTSNSKFGFGILLTTLFPVVELAGTTNATNTSGLRSVPAETFLGGKILIGCDPSNPACYSYNGTLTLGQPCMPEREKTALFDDELANRSQGPGRARLIERLARESCNISQALECRRLNSSDKGSYACACVDPSFGDADDAVEKSKYVRFDEDKKSCTFRVRFRCSDFNIPEGGRRFNKTYVVGGGNVKVMDGRPMWYAYRCGNRSRCNVRDSDVPKTSSSLRVVFSAIGAGLNVEGGGAGERDPEEGVNPHIVERYSLNRTRNTCICEQGSMPSESYEDGECEGIENREWESTGAFVGMFMMIVAFTVVLTILLQHDDSDTYQDKGARRNF